MNNENKDQNNINTNLNVPKDLLTLVNHSTPQNINDEITHTVNNNSNNKFIVDNNSNDLNLKQTYFTSINTNTTNSNLMSNTSNNYNASNNIQSVNTNQSVIPIVNINNTTPKNNNNFINSDVLGTTPVTNSFVNTGSNNLQNNNITSVDINNSLGNSSSAIVSNNQNLNTNIISSPIVQDVNDTFNARNQNIILNNASANNNTSNIQNSNLNTNSNSNSQASNSTYGYKANPMDINTLMKNTYNSNIELEQKTTKSNKWFFITSIGSGICFAISLFLALFSGGINFSFRGSEPYYQNKINENLSEYETAVVTDNIYEKVSVNNNNDAKKLIVEDSTNQKEKCNNPKVKAIESKIEKNYGIVAVNLCEMDYKLAKEIEKVLEKIHKEFPSTIKGRLTNLTLSNKGEGEAYAWFTAAKLFAKSNTFTTYPNVYKTSISLNAYYFLNIEALEAEMLMQEGSYFVPNSTGSTLIAHEFGHYLSFFAQLNNSKNISDVILLTQKNRRAYSNLINDSNEGVFSLKIIKEAYNNYNKKNKGEYSDLYEFRASISEYAVATDYYGEYIYDETIAEAFHDYYVNEKNATDASKEIVSVLKKYINK